MKKERLDVLLVSKGLFESREKARSSIMAGVVFVCGNKEDKPGVKVDVDSEIVIKENVHPYVSRGGLKLEKAIRSFNIDLKGKTTMDIGASTGGFTDCMLKNGAAKVFSVDVGYGQLAWELRNDERVVCMERTNIRYVEPQQLGTLVDFASVDVSFISLKKVIPVAVKLLTEEGELMCLIKPQFEAGRDKVGKHGVVRDPKVHEDVIKDIINFSLGIGLKVRGLDFSPIKGPEGNIEYLIYLSKKDGRDDLEGLYNDSVYVVEKSHEL
ncbi:TlyA family RNA methyltransferase [Acetivibrio cellulolyticus]|uniref:TlyA family RNA methyltransferase n=1 Tax=Acetivibrio cellulolyticus TaxID=35830 RepID=UPI0001E2D8F4|nr:TlyA family RNA methyltransferase [Acetivibrio cellulolyticus]